MFSENGIINNISSPQFKDNNFIISTSHENNIAYSNNFNNNNNLNLNSYAKSTSNSTISSIVSSPILSTSPTLSSSSSPSSPSSTTSPTSFAHQLRILIPNYDDLMDTLRSQQPHSSRAGGSGGMQNDRRVMNDRRMNSMVSHNLSFVESDFLIHFL